MIKNIPSSQAMTFADQVAYLPGQVVSKTIAQNQALSLTLFAFAAGEEISSHASDGDALVLALAGRGEITIAGKTTPLLPGEAILMPHHVPHAVYAPEPFKMLLTVVFPEKTKE